MYVLAQCGVDSYSQIERTTPYSAVAGKNLPVPQVDKREQVVAQVQRQSIMGGKASQDPEATAVYPSPVTSSTYPTTASSATASSSTESTAQMPRAYTPTPAARQPAQAAQPAAATAPSGRRPLPLVSGAGRPPGGACILAGCTPASSFRLGRPASWRAAERSAGRLAGGPAR